MMVQTMIPYTDPGPRLMAFIDGENLVARYQAMLVGRAPQPGVEHRQDEFVWNPNFHAPGRFAIARAYYYTSLVGDDQAVAKLAESIKTFHFCANEITAHRTLLYARVYKKPSKSQKSSTIDIQLAVDLLSQVYQHNAEAILLVTGDGDFAPLAEEVVSRGARLFIAALSDGLSPRLPPVADEFVNLDRVFLAAADPAA